MLAESEEAVLVSIGSSEDIPHREKGGMGERERERERERESWCCPGWSGKMNQPNAKKNKKIEVTQEMNEMSTICANTHDSTNYRGEMLSRVLSLRKRQRHTVDGNSKRRQQNKLTHSR